MLRHSLTCILVIAAAIASAGWTSGSRPGAQTAASESAAPGQLTVLNRKGEAAGLCPLKHTDVFADIAGYAARVTVKQEFTNPSHEPIEAVYSFPLPNDAAVDDMTMTIGSRVVRGEIKRKEEARGIYEAAKSAGQAAALLDQERPNIFTQQVANILPGARVVITIRYVNLLKYQEGQYEFVFPMVVGERYIPGAGYSVADRRGTPTGTTPFQGDPGRTPVVTDAARISPPIAPPGTRAGHDISLTVHLDAGLPLQGLTAGLHKVSIDQVDRDRAVIKLENQQEIPNKDFILRYTAAGSEMAEGLLAYAPARAGSAGNTTPVSQPGGYFTMMIQPPLAPPQAQISPKEMVFVIDQTGSQSGWPIAKAKETMRYCIANMNPGDTFQLIGFNTEIYPCFPAPVPNTPDNVAKALKFLEPLEGNGGTNILKSVDYALNLPDDPDRLRIICYMTDGYVGNDMQIIDTIQKNRGRARMFPFGIGNSVNRFLIEGMAREGRGAPEYLAVNTNAGAQFGGPMPEAGVKGAKEAAERFYRRIASPLLLDVHVDWNGLPVEDVYPKQIPDVFSAGPIVLKGRYTRAAEGDITVRGMLRGQPWSRTIHVSLPAAHSDGSAIPTLWAREKIEDLQNQDWLGAQTNAPHPEIQQQIINTALEYHLMSQYTSFVAVESRVVNIGGRQRTLDVPVETPDGVSYGSILGPVNKEAKIPMSPALGMRTRGYGFGKSSGAAGASANLYYSLGAGAPAGGGLQAKGLSDSLKESESLGLGRGANSARDPAQGQAAAKSANALGKLKGKDAGSLRAGKPARRAETIRDEAKPDEDRNGVLDSEKRLAAMKPEERRAIIERAKLDPALKTKMEAFRKTRGAKPETVGVEIWLNSVPAGGLAKLKALGFTLTATLTPNRLLLGTVPLDKLDALLQLSFVRRVDSPTYK